MVFNLHDQFETLRAEGRYDKLARSILERDVAIAGIDQPDAGASTAACRRRASIAAARSRPAGVALIRAGASRDAA